MTTMQVQPVNSTDLRIRAREILEATRWRGRLFQVQTFGEPSAILMPVELFNEWAQAMGITIERIELGMTPAGDAGTINSD
jgi:hypothetical protein